MFETSVIFEICKNNLKTLKNISTHLRSLVDPKPITNAMIYNIAT